MLITVHLGISEHPATMPSHPREDGGEDGLSLLLLLLSCPHYLKREASLFSPSMSERSELRRRREERMENGVKNLKGARLVPKTFSNHGFGDASRGHSPNLYIKKN